MIQQTSHLLRAYINTYISLLASTVCTFIVSAIFGSGNRFQAVDIQNATLAGGVIVGASADLMLQPFGALLAGCLAGTVSTLGYQVVQGKLFDWFNLHDSCGVHNLHGMPGVLGGLLSALLCYMADSATYGPALYLIMGNMAPKEGSEALAEAQALLPGQVEAGPGHSAQYQATIQLTALGITLAVAIGGGFITGIIINIPFLTSNMNDTELFDDFQFWQGPDEAEPQSKAAITPVPSVHHSRHPSMVPNSTHDDRRTSLTGTANGELAEYYRRLSAISYQQSLHSPGYPHTNFSPEGR